MVATARMAHGVGMLRHLCSWSFRHRRLVVVAWVAITAATVVFGAALAGPTAGGSLPDTDSTAAYDEYARSFPDDPAAEARIVVAVPDGSAERLESRRAEIDTAVTRLLAMPAVDAAVSPFEAGLVSPDGRVGLITVSMANVGGDVSPATIAAVEQVADELVDGGFRAGVSSFWFVDGSLPKSELIGIAAAMVILLIAFGSVVAMGLPLVTALVGVGTGLGLIGLWSNVVTMPDFAHPVAAMIGLGVGIDYALFIVTRYREELRAGRSYHDAAVVAMTTAGRAVLLAGATVVVSLLGMLLVGLDIMRGLGVASAGAVVVAVLAAVTLLPALLAIAGPRIDRWSVHRRGRRPSADGGSWGRWSRAVQRRPILGAVVGLIVLGALAAPVATMRLATADAGNDPAGTTTRVAYDLIAEGFGPGANGQLVVVAPDAAGDRSAALADALASTPGVDTVLPPAVAQNGTVAITVFPTTGPQDEATSELVHLLRDEVIPSTGVTAFVGGQTASDVDFSDLMASRLPWFIAAVLAGSFLLLLVEFRSLLVPLKAVVLNLLSIGAAYGVLVMVFQWGWFGLAAPGPIEPWAPMMLFAIVFGLSMDYEVFLLSSVKERFDAHGDSSRAVAEGLAATARVITAAAAIMIFVFGSFVVADLRALRLLGLGLAVAVLVDATVVRLLLVPATMELLGARNWWLPRMLRWIPGGGHVTASAALDGGAVARPTGVVEVAREDVTV
jgi:RND superfamily putative drug exporter